MDASTILRSRLLALMTLVSFQCTLNWAFAQDPQALRQRLRELSLELSQLAGSERQDEAAEIRKEISELLQLRRQIFQSSVAEEALLQSPQSDDEQHVASQPVEGPPRPYDPTSKSTRELPPRWNLFESPREVQPEIHLLAEQLEHLRSAANHLKQAGQHDLAVSVRKRAEELEHRFDTQLLSLERQQMLRSQRQLFDSEQRRELSKEAPRRHSRPADSPAETVRDRRLQEPTFRPNETPDMERLRKLYEERRRLERERSRLMSNEEIPAPPLPMVDTVRGEFRGGTEFPIPPPPLHEWPYPVPVAASDSSLQVEVQHLRRTVGELRDEVQHLKEQLDAPAVHADGDPLSEQTPSTQPDHSSRIPNRDRSPEIEGFAGGRKGVIRPVGRLQPMLPVSGNAIELW